MLFSRVVLANILINLTFSHVTKIVKRNPLLRKKRYLAFPADSNLVLTLSFIKPFMMEQPRGWNVLGELDVPFALPNDTRWFQKHRQKRNVLEELEKAFGRGGFNGSACVKRMICEARHYVRTEGKSLVGDFLSTIFMSSEIDLDVRYVDSCHSMSFAECEISFLSHILGSWFTT